MATPSRWTKRAGSATTTNLDCCRDSLLVHQPLSSAAARRWRGALVETGESMARAALPERVETRPASRRRAIPDAVLGERLVEDAVAGETVSMAESFRRPAPRCRAEGRADLRRPDRQVRPRSRDLQVGHRLPLAGCMVGASGFSGDTRGVATACARASASPPRRRRAKLPPAPERERAWDNSEAHAAESAVLAETCLRDVETPSAGR